MNKNNKKEEKFISFKDNEINNVDDIIYDLNNTHKIEKKINRNFNVELEFNYKTGKYIFRSTNKNDDKQGIEIEAEFYIKEPVYELLNVLENDKEIEYIDFLDCVISKKPENLVLAKWDYYNVNKTLFGKVKSIQQEKRRLFIEFVDKSKSVFVQGIIDGSNKDYEIKTKKGLLKNEYVSLRNDICRLFKDPCFEFMECRRVFYKHNYSVGYEEVQY